MRFCGGNEPCLSKPCSSKSYLPKPYLVSSMKALFERSIALLAILLTLPLMLFLAAWIQLLAPGRSVLYWSERLGFQGRIIVLPKFRTMHPNAEELLGNLLQRAPLLQREWNRYGKLKKDPRILPGMRLVRALSLDELPQLFLVLTGTLALVGPRPFALRELQEPIFQERLKDATQTTLRELIEEISQRAKPGITGLWQVSGRSNLSLSERLAFDLSYCNEGSFYNDLKLVCATLPAVVMMRGAY